MQNYIDLAVDRKQLYTIIFFSHIQQKTRVLYKNFTHMYICN